MAANDFYQEQFRATSDWFWDIIKRADRSRTRLAHILDKLEKDEIRQFENEFQKASFLLWDEDYFIPYMGENISEDRILNVCQWVVSQGKSYFADILINPQNLPGEHDIDKSQNLAWVAYEVYRDKFKDDLPVPLGGE